MIQDYVDHNMLLFLCFSQYVFFFLSAVQGVCVFVCVLAEPGRKFKMLNIKLYSFEH